MVAMIFGLGKNIRGWGINQRLIGNNDYYIDYLSVLW
ncbi:MAG: hypothetical protein FKGGLIKP_00747 [Sodalis sp. Fse]|nr:MAG: hypothetical protein FKGGLIKP_00747 [Sodalis sp. Fse]